MKYYGTIARSLIALLFVVAGVQKLMDIGGTAGFIGALGLPMPMIVAILVVLIEVPVALLFAYGYKVREMGYILMAYIALTTLVVHRDFSQGANLVMTLKNLAIIGGIMLAIKCADCDTCEVKA
jgi:putative oxidoreductase